MARTVKAGNVSTAKQGVVPLMRRLRRVLPGKVTKKSATEYLVEGIVEVRLNYWCRWSMDVGESHKTCNPHSIAVSLVADECWVGKIKIAPPTSRVFRTRSIRKRADGSLDVEAVATAVTNAIEAHREYVLRKVSQHWREVRAKNREVRAKNVVSQEIRRLIKRHPKRFRPWGRNGVRAGAVTVFANDSELREGGEPSRGLTWEVTINGLTTDELYRLLDGVSGKMVDEEDAA